MRLIDNLCENVSQASLKQVIENLQFLHVYHGTVWSLHQVLQRGKWQYLDILVVVHGHDRDFAGSHPSIQRGRLDANLASVRAMIPWCFAYDRLNYARYLPYYYAQIYRLPTTLPDAHDEFMQGGFSFSSAWLQQPLRKNPCRSSDRRNGEQGHTDARRTNGFSLKPRAGSRYYLTAEYRAVYLRSLRDMIGQGRSKLPHRDLQGSRIRNDEADIKSPIDLMENN